MVVSGEYICLLYRVAIKVKWALNCSLTKDKQIMRFMMVSAFDTLGHQSAETISIFWKMAPNMVIVIIPYYFYFVTVSTLEPIILNIIYSSSIIFTVKKPLSFSESMAY